MLIEKQRERAILVGAVMPGMRRFYEEESLKELSLLADTAGAEVVDEVVQVRGEVDSATLIGRGKVHQIARLAAEKQAGVVIFDSDLSPIQVKNLEKEIGCKILDRSGLILDIFAKRARTREAQIQVELAQLQYLLPRLTRRWTHLSRQEAGIGTRGPGETQLEVDRRAIRKRITHLKKELLKIESQRRVRRKRREDFPKVALVGYTNVGKSTLLNALAESEVFVEDRLFATLDATIRAFDLEGQRRVLLIDTVGFIRKLPAHLVASFRSTLEETLEADILVHVVDISHSNFMEQIGTVQNVLEEIGAGDKPVIMVFNKIDLIDEMSDWNHLKERFQGSLFISAARGIGLENLKREIQKRLEEMEVEDRIYISISETKVISKIYDLAEVLDRRYIDGIVRLRFRATRKHADKIYNIVKGLKKNADSDS